MKKTKILFFQLAILLIAMTFLLVGCPNGIITDGVLEGWKGDLPNGELKVPDSVVEIKALAFAPAEIKKELGEPLAEGEIDYSKQLEKLTFTKDSKLTKIGEGAFYGCTKLKEIDLSPCSQLTTIEAGAFDLSSSDFTEGFSEVKLPESITTIAECSFRSPNLKKVFIPQNANLKVIPSYSFMFSLFEEAEITLPDALEEMHALEGFFKTITIPQNVRKLVNEKNVPFQVREMIIKSTVLTEIGDNFLFSNYDLGATEPTPTPTTFKVKTNEVKELLKTKGIPEAQITVDPTL